MQYCILTILISFFLASAAFAGISKNTKKKILILGDSITEGLGVERDEAFPTVLQNLFRKDGYGQIEVVGSGVSGATSASGPGRMKWLLKSKSDVLVLELGANDGLRGLKIDEMKSNLKKTIALAKENKMQVVLIGIKLPANYGRDYNEKFSRAFADVAKDEKIDFIPFFLEKLMAKSKVPLVQKDGLHPNAEGHKLIADEVYQELVRILK